MRRHFHRCSHLRVIDIDVSELSGARRGGSQVMEELCEVRHLAPCVGLAECDVLSAAQKRALLAARATHLRAEEGGSSTLADRRSRRAAELEELRAGLLEERNEIAEENRRLASEWAGAVKRNPKPLPRAEEGELRKAGVSVVFGDDLRELRATRLDVLDRALDALRRGRFGDCARCGAPVEIARLERAPDTAVCSACASYALPIE
jgi:RNA polymerase-binding transcription factor DksA